jgi:hypothetical protein
MRTRTSDKRYPIVHPPLNPNAVDSSRCALARSTPESAGARNRHPGLDPGTSPVRHPELDSGSSRIRLVPGFRRDSAWIPACAGMMNRNEAVSLIQQHCPSLPSRGGEGRVRGNRGQGSHFYDCTLVLPVLKIISSPACEINCGVQQYGLNKKKERRVLAPPSAMYITQ